MSYIFTSGTHGGTCMAEWDASPDVPVECSLHGSYPPPERGDINPMAILAEREQPGTDSEFECRSKDVDGVIPLETPGRAEWSPWRPAGVPSASVTKRLRSGAEPVRVDGAVTLVEYRKRQA